MRGRQLPPSWRARSSALHPLSSRSPAAHSQDLPLHCLDTLYINSFSDNPRGAQVLGINIGDAHVVRNAGGRASADALRSIAISQRLLGTEEVYVIHHSELAHGWGLLQTWYCAAGRAAAALNFICSRLPATEHCAAECMPTSLKPSNPHPHQTHTAPPARRSRLRHADV